MRDEGIPTIVWLTPILPFVNDTEENIEGILDYCIRAKVHGIICFAMGVTLREGDREYFYDALDKHFPGLRKSYHEKYGYAYEVPSDNHVDLMHLLKTKCKEHGIICDVKECFDYLRAFPEKYEQMSLFTL